MKIEIENEIPEGFGSVLGGIFWQNWENHFRNSITLALEGAGYKDGVDKSSSQDLQKIIDWIEKEFGLHDRIPQIAMYCDYKSKGLSAIEFIVLVKQYIDGNHQAFLIND